MTWPVECVLIVDWLWDRVIYVRGIEKAARKRPRERVVARHVMSPTDTEAYNPNYIGGEMLGGVRDFREFFMRPLGTMAGLDNAG